MEAFGKRRAVSICHRPEHRCLSHESNLVPRPFLQTDAAGGKQSKPVLADMMCPYPSRSQRRSYVASQRPQAGHHTPTVSPGCRQ